LDDLGFRWDGRRWDFHHLADPVRSAGRQRLKVAVSVEDDDARAVGRAVDRIRSGDEQGAAEPIGDRL
jgi:hypothetical protein